MIPMFRQRLSGTCRGTILLSLLLADVSSPQLKLAFFSLGNGAFVLALAL
jgi:hypothetical protein